MGSFAGNGGLLPQGRSTALAGQVACSFGYVLHPVDLAMNKVMAAAGRRELRDIDLVTIHESIIPLGAVIWAAVEKSSGFTPED